MYFHQDCLDPPLTAFPSGRWMCPNHLNHFIDQNLLQSCAATERVKLWDKFANQRIDQHAVKLQFLRKIHSSNPPFRIKVKHDQKCRVKVPPSVKYHYANPAELELFNLYKPNSFICPTTAKINNLTENPIEKCDQVLQENDVKSENNATSPIKDNGVAKSEEKEDEEMKDEKKNEEMTNEIVEKSVTFEESMNVETIETGLVEEIVEVESSEKNDINSEIVQNVLRTDESVSDNNNCNNNEDQDLKDNVFINSGLGLSIKEGISLLERPILEALAQQRLEQILNPSNEYYQNINCSTKARAMMFPLDKTVGPPVFMTTKTLNIGTGGESELLLNRYGLCTFLSSKHAVIFYDKVIKFLVINDVFFFLCFLNY